MSRKRSEQSAPIAPLVQSFFESHLAAERGLSPNTVVANATA